MKKTFTFLVALFASFITFAAPIEQSTAKKIAESFLNQTTTISINGRQTVNRENKPIQLVYTATNISTTQQPLFYVFNRGNDNGFIIVSADTRVKQILGYSDTGYFDSKNIPDNMKYWLGEYEKEITYAIANLPDVVFVENQPKRVLRATNTVAPLLKDIKYNQNSPYNDWCPEINGKRTPTGCVATAVAQIMKFYEYPNKGTGSHSYTSRTRKFNLSVNFGEAEYDWKKIKSFYRSGETDEEKAEIAKLMHHVGVASEMDYKSNESGAITGTAVVGLVKFFGYANTADKLERKYYSATTWNNIIKTELEAGRPVLYAGGNAAGAGHAFVCDGFNEENLFHINWGWGGLSNGYFELSALTPSQQGIGSNNGGYNFGQDIYIGIKPTDENSPQETSVKVSINGLSVNKNVIKIGDHVTFTAENVRNAGLFTITDLNTSIVLEKENGEFIVLKTNRTGVLKPGSYYPTLSYSTNFPNNIEDGTYKIKHYYRNEKGEDVSAMTQYYATTTLKVEIKEGQVIFTAITPNTELQLTGNPTAQRKIYTKKKCTFEIPLRNISDYDYNAQIGIKLVKDDDNTVSQELNKSYVAIPSGTNKTVILGGEITVPVGKYKVLIHYDANNKQAVVDFPQNELTAFEADYTVMVEEPTPGEPILTISNVTYPKEVRAGQEMKITFTLTNTGGYAEAEITPYFFLPSYGSSVGSISSQTIILDKNESTTVEFIKPAMDLSVGEYRLMLYNVIKRELFEGRYAFEVKDIPSGMIANEVKEFELVITPNPVQDILNITLPKNAHQLFIYDMQGREVLQMNVAGKVTMQTKVAHLNQGLYIVRVIGKGINAVGKFLKK